MVTTSRQEHKQQSTIVDTDLPDGVKQKESRKTVGKMMAMGSRLMRIDGFLHSRGVCVE
jgi:hypothetical protein